MSKRQAIASIQRILKDQGYHSEEISETDVEKANSKRRNGVRQEDDKNDRVIKVLDKDWCSPEQKAQKKSDWFRWRNSPFLVEENSRPPPNTPDWLIAKSSEDENEPIPLLNHYSKFAQPTAFNFNEINKSKQKAVEMTLAPYTQLADFNFNKINKDKQKAIEMTPAPDTQPTDFGMNPPPSEMNPGPDTQPTDFNLIAICLLTNIKWIAINEINKGKQKAVEMTPDPDTQPTNFNFNKINKGKQKAVEMTPAPDTQPTNFGMNPSPFNIEEEPEILSLSSDDPVDSEILEILTNSEEVLKKFFELE
ncbi:hypothetical protein C2G38_2156864 [Gigaspora rosea]|uniref:Uncharacterized protein n=1 Tax=Gigaspora rosea TaxID=44941 RepID=A0A397W923_9GLOM|nr:hypothetical protein C2G38_2156864 [Gigaspora rosea]